MKISAVIITFNEERNIGRCLESLDSIVDEVVVVDSFSTDDTKLICENFDVRFLENPFEGHIEQKNYAIDQARFEWVLSLDADEALSNELRDSIRLAKFSEDFNAWELNRLTNYCGKWIRHCGWYPDSKVRLWHKDYGRWGGQNPHDRVILVDGVKLGQLNGDLEHFSCYSLTEHVQQIQKFSSIAAESAFKNGKRANLLVNILLGPFYTFIKKYFFQRGFLDGYFGFVISTITAFSRFLKYTKLRELENEKG